MKKIFLLLLWIFISTNSIYALNLESETSSQWNSGYCEKFYLTNNWTTVSNWKITFDIQNPDFSSKWNANFICSNTKCSLTAVDWNKNIKKWEKVELGFCSKNLNKPNNIKLNIWNEQIDNEQINTKDTETAENTENTNSENTENNYNTEIKSTWLYKAPFKVKNGYIYDKNWIKVNLFWINWFWFETKNHVMHWLWSRNWLSMIKQMKGLWFNSVRIPVCPSTIHWVAVNSINYDINKDLKWLNSLEILDKMVETFSKEWFYILLDMHRPDCNAISETPQISWYSLKSWNNDLSYLTKRYKNIPNVIWIDIKNEPHWKSKWGNGDINTDWKLQAEYVSKDILKNNPDILIFVEWIEKNDWKCEWNKNHWWWWNIEPISCYPLKIPKSNLVLSPHIYWPSVYNQAYFNESTFPKNMPAIWEKQIGRFVWEYPIVPWEFGWKYDWKDKIWQKEMINWFKKKDICTFYFWSWNPNSWDTGWILKDDWKNINTEKDNNLKRLMSYCSAKNENSTEENNTSTNVSYLYAPYVDTTLYPFPLLSQIAEKNKVYDYSLWFIIWKNEKCEASWGGYYNIEKWPDAWINWKQKYLYDEFTYLKNKWWKLVVSFGWASWTPLFKTCTNENNLVNQYIKVIDKVWTKYIDFDVEWAVLKDKKAIDRLIISLIKLQKKYNNDLHIWFTLPVMPEWLTKDGLYLVNKAKSNSLKFDWVNLMTMDYGSWYNKDMWDYAIQAAKNTKKQIWNIAIWITPMIWLNDIITENFDISDAKQISTYAQTNDYIKRVSYWSLNRDHNCNNNNVDLKCSSKNNQKIDWEYLQAFKWNYISNNLSKEETKNIYFNKININIEKYNKYYKIFERFFNIKKQKILENTNYQNDKYYNKLKLFNIYTNKLFTDIYYKNYKNIKIYLKDFKRIIKELKAMK